MEQSISVGIGPFVISFKTKSETLSFILRNRYKEYLKRPAKSGETVKAFLVAKPFNSIQSPRVLRGNNETVITRNDFISRSKSRQGKTDLAVTGNRYSLDSWLRVFLSLRALKRNGLLLHSAGWAMGKNTFISAGESGRGKSSIIRILGKKNALSDELVLLYKKRGKEYFGCSTPFWGELSKGSGRLFDRKLKAIFFIRHSKNLELSKLSESEAARGILKTSLFFSKHPADNSKLLETAAKIARHTPAYELGFSLNTPRSDITRLLDEVSRWKK